MSNNGVAVGPKHTKSLRGERRLAKMEGKTRYFTGLPCISGHVADRLTASGECVECFSERSKKRRINNAEKIKERSRELYAADRENRAKKASEYRKRNPEAAKESQKKWGLANRPKRTAAENARRAAKIQATPSWLTDEHKRHINLFYETAEKLRKASGIDLAVDHMVPIKGKNVTGLHVPWNLCIIGKIENSAKNNKISELIKYPPPIGVMVSGGALPWNWNKGA